MYNEAGDFGHGDLQRDQHGRAVASDDELIAMGRAKLDFGA